MENKETRQIKRVLYQESDYQGHLKLSTLLSLLSDLATENAYEVGMWNQELAKNYGWVLVKQTLQFKRPIDCNSIIELSTRAYHSSRVQFTRQYAIEDQNGVICNGHSIWTLLDLKKRSIVRASKIGLIIPEVKTYPYFLDSYKEIDETIATQFITTRKVLYSDVDMNQHMNNSRYIEWALDLVDYSLFQDHFIQEVSMHYKKELPPHSEVDLYYGRKDNAIHIVMKQHDSDVECFCLGLYLQTI